MWKHEQWKGGGKRISPLKPTKLYGINELAELLNRSKRWVELLVLDGVLPRPTFLAGRMRFWTGEQVQAIRSNPYIRERVMKR
jgi:hypothetical protein